LAPAAAARERDDREGWIDDDELPSPPAWCSDIAPFLLVLSP
jgi:hypothetical protein